MPLNGIVNTARSLSYYLRLQEVTANNLANSNTDAFKADRLTARILPGGPYPVPVQATDLEQGSFRDTGRPLDLGLDGPGFFVVATEHGERLTRGGSLRLDPEGRLTDAHGSALQGENGPIVVTGSNVEVQPDGTVLVDGASAGRLRRVQVDDPGALRKEGYGRFVPAGELHEVVDGVTKVRQGAVEEPNLDPVLSMVDLVSIQRAYSANIEALRVMDGALGIVTGDVGRVE